MRRRALLASALLAPVATPIAVPPACLAADLVVEPDGYRMDDYRAPVPGTVRGGEVVHVGAMRGIVERQAAVLVDVLPAPRKPAGMQPGTPWLPRPHLSLPGAFWWPDVGRGVIPDTMAARFRERLTEVAGEPRRLVVFFCLKDCWMSWNATKRAATYGARAAWFPEGVDGWETAGMPVQEVEPELLG